MPIDHSSVTYLVAQLGQVPTELRRELRPKLTAGAQHITDDMKRRASYSSRIPSAIKVGSAFASRGGVRIRVDSRRAPHARPLEGATSRGGFFRHPVYGNRSNWVSQSTRPFFFPAVKAGREQLQKHIADAVRSSLRKVAS